MELFGFNFKTNGATYGDTFMWSFKRGSQRSSYGYQIIVINNYILNIQSSLERWSGKALLLFLFFYVSECYLIGNSCSLTLSHTLPKISVALALALALKELFVKCTSLAVGLEELK